MTSILLYSTVNQTKHLFNCNTIITAGKIVLKSSSTSQYTMYARLWRQSSLDFANATATTRWSFRIFFWMFFWSRSLLQQRLVRNLVIYRSVPITLGSFWILFRFCNTTSRFEYSWAIFRFWSQFVHFLVFWAAFGRFSL